jgi:hypothetical protein
MGSRLDAVHLQVIVRDIVNALEQRKHQHSCKTSYATGGERGQVLGMHICGGKKQPITLSTGW